MKIRTDHGIVTNNNQALIDFAYTFAYLAHEGQVRKYTGEPYINHPVEVAKIVSSVTNDDSMVCAALLHDVIEDCGVKRWMLEIAGLGFDIADMVEMLSDASKPEDGVRKVRKEIDRQHTAKSSPKAKTIKLADLISNSASIIKHDKRFAKTYMKEKELLLEVLKDGDAELYETCELIIASYKSD